MKTLEIKLKFGIIIIGLVILFSCNTSPASVSAIGVNTINRSIPVIVTATTRYTGHQLTRFFKNSAAEKVKGEVIRNGKNKQIRRFIPISIGLTGEINTVSSIFR